MQKYLKFLKKIKKNDFTFFNQNAEFMLLFYQNYQQVRNFPNISKKNCFQFFFKNIMNITKVLRRSNFSSFFRQTETLQRIR